jgi:hypothetical protein
MAPAGEKKEREEKIITLEKELSDLRQGLCIVQDYYHDLEKMAGEQDAGETVDESLLKPLIRENEEFEGIWKFHAEMLIPDPGSQVPCSLMYEAFVTYCEKKGRDAIARSAFDFMLLQMGVRQVPDRGIWLGYRIRPDRA